MNSHPCTLYRDFPSNGLQLIQDRLSAAVDRTQNTRPIPVLFRADDIGVLSSNFLRLLDLFRLHRMPLCLAVVPTWLTHARWSAIKDHVDTDSTQWCWHQHGWSHTNHQRSGKKAEFGQARSKNSLAHDLTRGRDRLLAIGGTDFSPFFTPPWNRCSDATLQILTELGFRGISRSRGEQVGKTSLEDFFINVDLHTRKEPDGRSALEALCAELRQAVDNHYVSIMIHHQMMNDRAFDLLDLLLAEVAENSRLAAGTFNDLSGLARA